jgi:hypothetical protein
MLGSDWAASELKMLKFPKIKDAFTLLFTSPASDQQKAARK